MLTETEQQMADRIREWVAGLDQTPSMDFHALVAPALMGYGLNPEDFDNE